MITTLDKPEEDFRREVVAFLDGYGPVGGFFHHEGDHEVRIRDLYRALGQRGWLSLSWPTAVGGMALPPIYEFLLWDEMAYARAARPPLGSGIVAKTIIAHGTPDHHERFLPGLRDGTVFFSLGYSEPEAGSDLGRVRMRAVPAGDHYILNGEKRWTSGGHRADFLWVLCRTGDLESRSRGLSLLIVDRCSPGITISPIPVLDGGRLNEVRFDDVEVPMANRVGAEGEAWTIMGEALATERHVQFPPKRVQRDFEDLAEWVASVGLAADPVVRERLAQLRVEVEEAKALALIMLDAVQHNREAAVEAASNKLFGAELCQRIARAAFEFGAPEAVVRGPMVEFLWRQSICETIGGGTSEIMRGVISRHLLGLAGSR